MDVLLALPKERVATLADRLRERAFDVSPQDLYDAIREGGHATAFDTASDFHVDIAFAKRPEEIEEVENATDLSLPRGKSRVVGPEDTIAFKLKFGSEQDLKDARSILLRQEGRLDEGRLHAVTARLGVSVMLKELRAQLRDEA